MNESECEVEYVEFTLTLIKAFPRATFHEAWRKCGAELDWIHAYPNLMRLWQIMLVMLASTAACERGFSKQNRIKDNERSNLCLETLDMLMLLSLSAPQSLHEVDWEVIYEAWGAMKARRPQSIAMIEE